MSEKNEIKSTDNANSDEKLLIIDGYGFIFRAYYVQPQLISDNGTPVGALYGVASMILKIIDKFKPKNIAVALDSAGPTFRHDIYKEYKSHRPEIANDLIIQLKLLRKLVSNLNIAILERKGFEADDIIASIASVRSNKNQNTIIISSDKDLMQLMSDNVEMYDPTKNKILSLEDVNDKFGVTPDKVTHVQALIGDKSDNIPGAAGIGPKTAAELINNFGSLESIYEDVEQVAKPRIKNILTKSKDDVLTSFELVKLKRDLFDDGLDVDFKWNTPSVSQISECIFKEFGFHSLKSRIENIFGLVFDDKPQSGDNNLKDKQIDICKIDDNVSAENMLADIKKAGIISVSIFKNIDNEQEGSNKKKNNEINHGDVICIVFACDSQLYLIECSYEWSDSNFFNFKHSDQNITKIIYDIFLDRAIKKITFNIKNILFYCNFIPESFEDLQLMDYCISAGLNNKSVLQLIKNYDANKNDNYFPSNTDIVADFYKTYVALQKELVKHKHLQIYHSIDIKLSKIIFSMEREGVSIDIALLKQLSKQIDVELSKLKKEIYDAAGSEFNIASPKQLGVILFEKLSLPFGKLSRKTQTYSTNVDVLNKLASHGYDIAKYLLRYRHLTKLKTSYTDTLPNQININSWKIHTTFLQNSTSTGRLSSHNPNVQNIPMKTKEGSVIRAAFIASKGNKLISADYSQIELRILSHIANIEPLKLAFKYGEDIHSKTASQIFDIDIKDVTPDLRRKAKAINFGIIYGISAFGLASQLDISQKEASNYISKYFTTYPGIQKYMDDTVKFAKENGYVKNLLGRKCFISNINNSNISLQGFAKRAAINAPIQSLAADIVKIAMINVSDMLSNNGYKAKMIMQIHDEIIIDTPDNEVDIIKSQLPDIMNVLHQIELPVQVKIGENWRVMQ